MLLANVVLKLVNYIHFHIQPNVQGFDIKEIKTYKDG